MTKEDYYNQKRANIDRIVKRNCAISSCQLMTHAQKSFLIADKNLLLKHSPKPDLALMNNSLKQYSRTVTYSLLSKALVSREPSISVGQLR